MSGKKGSASGRVVGLARGGDAIVDTERGRVFAAGGAPGDEVTLHGLQKRRGRWSAKSLEVLVAGASRVTPPCEYAGRCGGCGWMHVSGERASVEKRAVVARAVGAEVDDILLHRAGPELGYRRRARLAFDGRRGGRVGYRARASSDLVGVDTCLVLDARLGAALGPLAESVAGMGRGEAQLGLGLDGPVVTLMLDATAKPEAYAAAEAAVGEGAFEGIAVAVRGIPGAATYGDPREAVRTIDGDTIRVRPGGFAQANDHVNEALVTTALEWLAPDGKEVIELFAGHGNFTLPLARRAARVRAYEIDPQAAAENRAALDAHGLRAHVEARDLSGGKLPKADAVLLDPPRLGAAATIEALVEARPSEIVYVSCNPATLGRDLRGLRESGYEIARVAAFDMFPQTPHVETLVSLKRS